MVTMRRDVAAVASNSIFDRVDRDSELTSYDIFMRNKRQTEANDFGSSTVTADTHAISGSDLFGYRKPQEKEPKASTAYADYDEYMRAQINRKTVGKILSKEEFYQEKYDGGEVAEARPARAKGRMTKAGKIFTAVYVLMVVVVASIIIAINTGSDGGKVSASADATGEIKALTIESEDIERNTFDDILDGLSNK